ncbi:hypothetical protein ABZ154_26200 [Streptomyces sp. NPDC006261]
MTPNGKLPAIRLTAGLPVSATLLTAPSASGTYDCAYPRVCR